MRERVDLVREEVDNRVSGWRKEERFSLVIPRVLSLPKTGSGPRGKGSEVKNQGGTKACNQNQCGLFWT